MKRKWVVKKSIPDDFILQHAQYPKSLLQILYYRGLKDAHSIELFLRPPYGDVIYDPFLLPDMRAGVERVIRALESKEPITVYADYDADAVTAAAVMIRTLRAFGADVSYYIPDRFAEGYGVNAEAIKEIAKRGARLIITVDCGITAVEEVAVAGELGVDVVVTDHHHVPSILPKSVANINPHRADSIYPFRDLTGVGVAFKFVQALIKVHDQDHRVTSPGWEKWLLDLVAVGTVADCQDLLGENRIFVKYGLTVISKSRWPGVRAI